MISNRKAKALENELTAQQRMIKEQDAEILLLQTTIRDMDQQIYNMGQCSSWEQMQPRFSCLLADTMFRKAKESKRIQDVPLPEMRYR